MRRLKYDKDIYAAIVETGRLVPLLDTDFGLSDVEAPDCSKFIVGEFEFESKYIFDTTDLGRICRVHAPLKFTCYWEKCKNNILTVKFYDIPVRGE